MRRSVSFIGKNPNERVTRLGDQENRDKQIQLIDGRDLCIVGSYLNEKGKTGCWTKACLANVAYSILPQTCNETSILVESCEFMAVLLLKHRCKKKGRLNWIKPTLTCNIKRNLDTQILK